MLNSAKQIVKVLQDNGHQAVFAGGCVRDMLLGVEPKDYDIATSAKPEEIEKIFDHTIAIGKSFGVITVLQDGFSFEVATFRSDGEYTDGRHPDQITFSSMEEDAKRRDLTINGMFYDPIKDSLHDFVEGLYDLKSHFIRFIGDPNKRIKEDKLRMLRAVRFATTLGFSIVPNAVNAIFNNVHEISSVSKERVIAELIKILQSDYPSKGLNTLYITKLLLYIIPEIYWLKGCKQDPFYHPEGDVWGHTIKLLDAITKVSKDPIVLLAALLHDVGKPYCTITDETGKITSKKHEYIGAKIAEIILKSFKCSNEIIDSVHNIVYNHMIIKRVQQMKKSKVIKMICKPYFEKLLMVSCYDSLAGSGNIEWFHWIVSKKEEYFKEGTKPKLPECLINGNDLIKLGFKPGPIFKTILNNVLNLQLEDKILTKELALSYVRSKDWSDE